MSEYSPENPDSVWQPNDAGHMQTTDTVPNLDNSNGGDPLLSAGLNLSISLGSLGHKIDKMNYDMACREQARLAAEPNVVPLAAQAVTIPALGVPALVDFGTPQAGRQWDLRTVMHCVAGTDVTDTVHTTFVSWYVGALPPAPVAAGSAQITGSQLKWNQNNTTGLQVDKVGPGLIPVRANEHLFAVVVGASAGTVGLIMYLSATVADAPAKAASPVVVSS